MIKSIFNETIIHVIKEDGKSITKTFGQKIFSKEEKESILRQLYSAVEPVSEVIIAQVNNVIDSYQLDYDDTVIAAQGNVSQAINDIPGKNNYWNILEGIHSEIISKLTLAGLFADYDSFTSVDSEINEDHNLEINIPTEYTTEANIREIYEDSNLPYLLRSVTDYGDIYQVVIELPKLGKSDYGFKCTL